MDKSNKPFDSWFDSAHHPSNHPELAEGLRSLRIPLKGIPISVEGQTSSLLDRPDLSS